MEILTTLVDNQDGTATFKRLRPAGYPLPFAFIEGERQRIVLGGLVSGVNDLYTVPTGKKAIIGHVAAYNPTGSAVSVKSLIKIGGTYYRIQNGTGYQAVGAAVFTNIAATFVVFEAGEALALDCTASGLNVVVSVLEIDERVKLNKVLVQLTAGDNVLLEAAEADEELIAQYGTPAASSYSLQFGSTLIVNETGGMVTFEGYLVPSGGSPVLFRKNTNQANGSLDGGPPVPVLKQGDQVVINSSSSAAGQYAFVTYYEEYI